MYLVLQYLDVYFSRHVFKYGIQWIFYKLSNLASKKFALITQNGYN